MPVIRRLLGFKGIYHLRLVLLALNRRVLLDSGLAVSWSAVQLLSWDRWGRVYLFCWSSCAALCSTNRCNAGFASGGILEFLDDLALHWCQIFGQGLHPGHLGHSITVASSSVEDGRSITDASNSVSGWSRLLHVTPLMTWERVIDKFLDIIETATGLCYPIGCTYFGHTWVLSLRTGGALQQCLFSHIDTESRRSHVSSGARSDLNTEIYQLASSHSSTVSLFVGYLQLLEWKTFRDSVPKPLVYRERFKGNARLNTFMLIVVPDWSYHPGPGLCLSAIGIRSYFVPFSANVRRMLGVRVRMWLLAAYVPSLLMPSTAAYAPGPGVLRILNTMATRKE